MFESMEGLARGITRTLAKPFIEVTVNQDFTGQSDPGVQKSSDTLFRDRRQITKAGPFAQARCAGG
jgi:hypothetical protein